MKLRVIGIEPGTAISHTLQLCDGKEPADVISLLIHNKFTEMIPANEIPKDFTSNKLVDITVGELLGLGTAGAWYNALGEENGNTYQVVVAVDDATKRDIEFVLSDGAIWHNQQSQKMVFQQVSVQGYYPNALVGDDEVIAAINDKISRRKDYPDNCGLIVNVYSDEGKLDFQRIINECDTDSYNVMLCIVYQLPDLNLAVVNLLDKNLSAPELSLNRRIIRLNAFERGTHWEIRENP